MMMEKPGIAIAIMAKKKEQEGEDKKESDSDTAERDGMIKDIAKEIMTAIKDGKESDFADALISLIDIHNNLDEHCNSEKD
jgi:hypothetical protein